MTHFFITLLFSASLKNFFNVWPLWESLVYLAFSHKHTCTHKGHNSTGDPSFKTRRPWP